MKIRTLILTVSVLSIITFSVASAEVYSYGDKETAIGIVRTHETEKTDSLIEIARKFGLGYNEIVEANPELDPFVPGEGVSVKIPTSWILPNVSPHEGIVINLSEMRLYYFFKERGSRLVATFPIGTGTEENETPVGNFNVIEKIANPTWYVPESIRKGKPYLPKVVPPGPDNPLGSHALRLSSENVLIHGTNKPWSIGRNVSHGCIRLYPEDIPRLFQLVPIGTRVTVVRQSVKVGLKGDKVYLEVHNDRYSEHADYLHETVKLLRQKNLLKSVNTDKMYTALQEKSGIPVDISN